MKRLLFLISALMLAACGEKQPTSTLKPLYELPHFTFTERSGQPFDSEAMRGKVWVADFFFASCPGTCLELSKRMAEVHKATRDLADVRLLSISTDEKDTPEVLREYAKAHGADERWSFLTGEKKAIFDLSVQGFKLALVEPDNVDTKEKFIHSTRLVLVDKRGWIRGYYDGIGDEKPGEVERLVADIKRLLAE